jgi:hypothetical protein
MKIAHILGATAALVIVAGCADYGVGYYGPGPMADVEYDGYYDGAYGPIYDGYWGGNGGFYYRNSANDHYRPAGGSHFRHDAAPGYNHVHGTAHASPRGGDHHPG